MFDAIAPATVAADHTVSQILNAQRAARLVEQHAIDPSLPGLQTVLDRTFAATFGITPASPYEAEVSRAVERVVVDHLMNLAADASMPQVRAIAMRLDALRSELGNWLEGANDSDAAHYALLARDVTRFLERRPGAEFSQPASASAPPGAPIGQPALEWLSQLDATCGWDWEWQH